MSETAQTLTCPNCGAALEPPAGASTMKCGYCGTSVVIPADLRASTRDTAGAMPMDFGQLMAKAIRMGAVVRLARTGRRDEAIKLYQENSGVSAEQASQVIDGILSGKTPMFDQETRAAAMGEIAQIAEAAREARIASGPVPKPRGSGLRGLLVFLVIAAALVLITLNSSGPLPGFLNGLIAKFNPAALVHPLLTFGAPGTSAGTLQDPRAIAVDGNGNIYVADYGDGRIQVFDPGGKFVLGISAGANTNISGLAVSRDGKLYATYSGEIWIYDAKTGQSLGKLSYKPAHAFGSLAVGPDGSLYAVSSGEDILRFRSDGVLLLAIPAAIRSISGVNESNARLAVDGQGNIYALGTSNAAVFEFSPAGKYIRTFGGKNAGYAPLNNPIAIAVDGYGRVFVSTFSNIQVFGPNGIDHTTFNVPDNTVTFGMAFNNQGNLYAATNQPEVVVLQVSKP